MESVSLWLLCCLLSIVLSYTIFSMLSGLSAGCIIVLILAQTIVPTVLFSIIKRWNYPPSHRLCVSVLHDFCCYRCTTHCMSLLMLKSFSHFIYFCCFTTTEVGKLCSMVLVILPIWKIIWKWDYFYFQAENCCHGDSHRLQLPINKNAFSEM